MYYYFYFLQQTKIFHMKKSENYFKVFTFSRSKSKHGTMNAVLMPVFISGNTKYFIIK